MARANANACARRYWPQASSAIAWYQKANKEKEHVVRHYIFHTHKTHSRFHSVLRSISYISNNLASEITLEQLAAEAHLSKYHFCRLFKKHFAMTPMEFIACLRIRKAQDLLLSS